jgi:predicted dithiol-disulfide oxidoreductase (DUF899 family)
MAAVQLRRRGKNAHKRNDGGMVALPEVVSREEWLTARRDLLIREKEHTRAGDALNADRRRLPMVRVDKDYVFEGPDGATTLGDLFAGRRQLVVRHVMFGPDWDAPCPGCSGDIRQMTRSLFDDLAAHQTTHVLVSRAPYAKIEAAQRERGWDVPWFSAFGSDFNYDLQVSLDAQRPQLEYNFRVEPELLPEAGERSTELAGISCFLRTGDEVFHTYSTYARGMDYLAGTYPLMDLTALGRQEDWEEPKDRNETVKSWDPETFWTTASS